MPCPYTVIVDNKSHFYVKWVLHGWESEVMSPASFLLISNHGSLITDY
jgi:hypothetical protein